MNGTHAPATLPFANPDLPEPLLTLVNQSQNAAGWTTAVTRVFPPSVGYCGRCPRSLCHTELGVCLVSVQEYIADDEAPELSTLDRPWLISPPAADGLSRSRGPGA